MNVGTLSADVEIKLDGLDKGMSLATAQIEKLKSQLTGSSAEFDKLVAATERYADKIGLTATSIGQLEAAQAKSMSEYIASTAEFERSTKGMERVANSIQWKKQVYGEASKSAKALQKEYDALKKTNDQAAKSVDKASEEYEKYSISLNKAYEEMEKLTEAQQISIEAATQLGEELLGSADVGLGGIETLADAMDDAGDGTGMLRKALSELGSGGFDVLIRGAASAAGSFKIFGNASEGARAASTGLSTVIRSLVKGGGLLAIAPAAIAGAAALYDWASGAKAAREATEKMTETAEKWKSTQAKTIYDTGNDPFVRFAVDKTAFKQTIGESETFVADLIRVWSDGKKETNEIVKQYADGFKDGSDKIREGIESQEKMLSGLGVKPTQAFVDQVKADKKQLDEWDKEISDLLKKKQNKLLSEQEQARLNEISEQRIQLELKYTTNEDTGFDKILTDVEAEIERLKLLGKSAGSDLYADALKGSAQGYAEAVDTLNQSYDEQYAVIQKIADAEARDAALKALNTEYQKEMATAAEQYADTIAKLAPPVFQSEEVKKGAEDFKTLNDLIDQYTKTSDEGKRSSIVEQIGELTKDMDEGSLASFITAMTQVNEQAQALQGLDIDPSTIIPTENLDTAATSVKTFGEALQFLSTVEGPDADKLAGVKGLFEAVSDELGRVTEEMSIDAKVNATLEGLPDTITIEATVPVTLTNLPDSLTINATVPAKLSGLPETITIQCKSPVTLTDIPDKLIVGAESPVTLTGLPEMITVDATSPVTFTGIPDNLIVDAESPVTLTEVPDGIVVQCDSPVTLSNVPTELTVQANIPVALSDVPDSITVKCDAPVSLSNVPNELEVQANAPVTLTGIPDSITVQANAPVGLVGVPDSVTINSASITNPLTVGDVVTGAKVNSDGSLTIPVTVEYNPKSFELSGSNLKKGEGILGLGADTDTLLKGVTKDATELASAVSEARQSSVGLENVMDRISALGPDGMQKVSAFVEQFNAAIAAGEQPTEDQIAQMQSITDMYAALAQLSAAGMDTGLFGPVTEGLEAIFSGDWSGKIEPAVAALQSLTDKAQEVGAALPQTAAEGIVSGTGAVTGAAEAMAGETESAAEMDGGPIGSSFSSGLASGILSGQSGVVNAAAQVAGAAAAAAKAELDIHSPSKVGSKIGSAFSRGIAGGIIDDVNLVARASAMLARSAVMPIAGLKIFDFPEPEFARAARDRRTANDRPVLVDLDYDRLIDGMASRPAFLHLNGRVMADTLANDNSRALSARSKRIIAGYGG